MQQQEREYRARRRQARGSRSRLSARMDTGHRGDSPPCAPTGRARLQDQGDEAAFGGLRRSFSQPVEVCRRNIVTRMEEKPMTDSTPEQQPTQAEREAALFGPAGKADHSKGETITFCDRGTGGKELTGKIIYVRAPAPAIVGGRVHPTLYMVFVEGEHILRAVSQTNVVEKPSEDRNTGS